MPRPRRPIDWHRELEAIELAAARRPRKLPRRSTLPPAVLARITRDADREYRRWFRAMDRAIGRLLAGRERSRRRR